MQLKAVVCCTRVFGLRVSPTRRAAGHGVRKVVDCKIEVPLGTSNSSLTDAFSEFFYVLLRDSLL